MFALYHLLSLLCITSLEVFAQDQEIVAIDLKKQHLVRRLTTKDLHRYTTNHVLFNFGNADSTKADFITEPNQQLSFHELAYTSKVALGTPKQTVNLIYELAISDVMVVTNAHCGGFKKLFTPFCRAHNGINVNKLKKQKDSKDYDEASRPTFDMYTTKCPINGKFYYVDVKVGSVVVKQAQIAVIQNWAEKETMDDFLYGNADGIIGVGRIQDTNFKVNNVAKSPDDKNVAKAKQEGSFTEKLVKERFYSVAFQLYKDKYGNERGQFVMNGEHDPSRYNGQFNWIPYESPNVYWRVLSTIMTIGTADGIATQFGTYRSVLDPGTSVFVGPKELIGKIHNTIFQHLELRSKTLIDYQTVEFDCAYMEQLPLVIIRIQNVPYIFKPEEYVVRVKTTCMSGFMAVPKTAFVVLGEAFLRKNLVVFHNQDQKIGIAESVLPKKKGWFS